MCFVQFSRPISTGKLLWITHCNVLHFWSRKWLFRWYFSFSIRRLWVCQNTEILFLFCHVVKTLRGKDSYWMLSASQLRSWPKDEKIAAYLLQTWRSSSEVKLMSIVSLFINLLAPSFPFWSHLFLLLLLLLLLLFFFLICFVFCPLHSLFFHFQHLFTPFLSLCLLFSLYMYVCWFVNLLVPSFICVLIASSLPLFLLSCAKCAVVVFSLLSYMLLNLNIYF